MIKFKSFTQSKIFPILLVNFIGTLGYGIILPFLAFLIIDFGGNEILYGIIASTYPLFQMVGAPLLGKWSDRIGRKRVLLISQIGTLFSWLIFLIAFFVPLEHLFQIKTGNYGVMVFTIPLVVVLFARSLDGLTGGNISVANAYLSDISSEEDRKKNFGKMAASMSLGFMLGPAIAALLGMFPNSNVLTIIVAAGISLLGVLAIYFFLPEVKLNKQVYPCSKAKLKKAFGAELQECYDLETKNDSGWMAVARQQKAPLMIALFFLIFLAFNFFFATFTMYSSSSLNWSARNVGFFFTVLSGVMILTQGPVLAKLSSKYSDEVLFTAGALLMVFTFSLFTSTHLIILYLGAVLYGLGNGIMWPSYLAILSKTGSPQRQGTLQGLANGVGSFASIIGLVLGGFLLAKLSANIYFISSFLLLIIAIGGRFLHIRKEKATDKIIER